VIWRFAGTVWKLCVPVFGSKVSVPTDIDLNSGMYFDTGSSSDSRPSSMSDRAATLTIGFVIE
jgi:hypothetical protein